MRYAFSSWVEFVKLTCMDIATTIASYQYGANARGLNTPPQNLQRTNAQEQAQQQPLQSNAVPRNSALNAPQSLQAISPVAIANLSILNESGDTTQRPAQPQFFRNIGVSAEEAFEPTTSARDIPTDNGLDIRA